MKFKLLMEDRRGEAIFLFLLFILVAAVMFLRATSVISHYVSLRSHLSRISEEIAFNIAVAGMDMEAALEGRIEIDQTAANNIAREVIEREGATNVTYSISLNEGFVLVDVFYNNLRKRGIAHTLTIQ